MESVVKVFLKEVRKFYYTLKRNLPMILKLSGLQTDIDIKYSLQAKIIYFEIYSWLLLYKAMSKVVRKYFVTLTIQVLCKF